MHATKHTLLLSLLVLTQSSMHAMKRKNSSKNHQRSKSPVSETKWSCSHQFQTHKAQTPKPLTNDWRNLESSRANVLAKHPTKNIIAIGLNKDTKKSDNIQIWNTDTQICIKRIALDNLGSINALAFSPCGNYLVASSYHDVRQLKSTLSLWNANTGTLVQAKILNLPGPCISMALKPNTKIIALVVGNKQCPLLLLNLENLKITKITLDNCCAGKQIASIIWHPAKENILCLGLDDGSVLFQTTNGIKTNYIKNVHLEAVSGVDLNNDGSRLVSVSKDGHIKLWDLEKQTVIFESKKNGPQLHDVIWKNNKIYTASNTVFEKNPFDDHFDREFENNPVLDTPKIGKPVTTIGCSVFEYSMTQQ